MTAGLQSMNLIRDPQADVHAQIYSAQTAALKQRMLVRHAPVETC